MSDPRSPSPRAPRPLPGSLRRMLAEYREHESLADEAEDRIWAAIDDAPDLPDDYDDEQFAVPPRGQPYRARRGGRGHWVWLGAAVAAAAAVVLVWRWDAATAERQAAEHGSAAPMTHEGTRPGGTAERNRPTGSATLRRAPGPPDSDASVPAATPRPPSAPAHEADTEPSPSRSGKVSNPSRPRPTRTRPTATGHEPPAAEPPAAKPPSTLAKERELVAAAWQALAKRDDTRALALATEHRQRFAHGLLAPERAAIATIARCRLQPAKAADHHEQFATAHPASVHAKQVDEACGSK